MIKELFKDLYTFPVTLLNNPLKSLNCYVIKGGEKNILIDSGFNHPLCIKQLTNAMKHLGLNNKNTEVFFTHLHSDHTGNASTLEHMGYKLMMSQVDYEEFIAKRPDLTLEHEGLPYELLISAKQTNAAVKYMSKRYECSYVYDGEHFISNEYDFELVLSPGHTKGHICLYDREKKIMLTGDHVLFDITPNICTWGNGTDALGEYLKSLDRISQFEVKHALPSHRNTSALTMQERIEQLKVHHAARLAEAYDAIAANPDITAYDLAGHMAWKIRAKDWDSFPNAQKWFAVSEALAHVDHLVATEQIVREACDDGMNRYRVK